MLPGCDRTVCPLAYFKYISVVFLWIVIWLLESANGGAGVYACAIDAQALSHLHAIQKVQMAPALGSCLITAGGAQIQFCNFRSLTAAKPERPRKCGFLVGSGYCEPGQYCEEG